MDDESSKIAERSAEVFSEVHPLEQKDQKAEEPLVPSKESQIVNQAGSPLMPTELLVVEQRSELEAETPAENSIKLQRSEQEAKHNAEMAAEASIQSQTLESEATTSLGARTRRVKKTDVKSSLKAKGKAAVKVQKKIVKKVKGASLVVNEHSKAGECSEGAKGDLKEQESSKEAMNTVGSFTELQTSAQETEKEAEMPDKTSVQAKAKFPQKRTPDSLKAGAKIVKEALPGKSMNNAKKKAANKVQNKILKRKGVSVVLNGGGGNGDGNSREPATSDIKQVKSMNDGDEDIVRNKASTSNQNEDETDEKPALGGRNDSGKTLPVMHGKFVKSNRKQRKRKNSLGLNANDGREILKKEKLENNQADKGKRRKEKEKIEGLIFLCSTKTKPDCLNYRVMGLPESQKEVVLAIKPGLTLFLYDFDLKLMYGIYKASSAGGKKIEPRAFGGSFPYQVRFRIHVDCFPLPETIFRKAMMENYTRKHKFKTELSFKQVRKLSELFRPVEIHPGIQPRSNDSPRHSARKDSSRDRDARLSVRESRHHLPREKIRDDPYAGRDERRYALVAHEGDRLAANQEVREEPGRKMFPTEAEYRAYGLLGERRYSDLPSRPASLVHYIASPVDPYWEDLRRRRRQSDVLYRDAVPLPPGHREHVGAASSYPEYRGYHRTYSLVTGVEYPLGDRYLDYRGRADVSSSDAYLSEPGRDYRHREMDPVERLYAHSSHADYDLTRRYQTNDPNPADMPFSSRCTFAGPR